MSIIGKVALLAAAILVIVQSAPVEEAVPVETAAQPKLPDLSASSDITDDDSSPDLDKPVVRGYEDGTRPKRFWGWVVAGASILHHRLSHHKHRHHHRAIEDEDIYNIDSRAADDKIYVPKFDLIVPGVEAVGYATNEGENELLKSRVTQADLYTRQLLPGTPRDVQAVLGGKQSGVVLTLADRRRLLLVKGDQKGSGNRPTLYVIERLVSSWSKVSSKPIESSVVADFVAAAGSGYDLVKNNGNQAAQRMMRLP